MQNHEEPDAEPGAACRTPFCKKIGGTADFEVNFLAPEEETDGLFLSYTVVQGTPSVCGAFPGIPEQGLRGSQYPTQTFFNLPVLSCRLKMTG